MAQLSLQRFYLLGTALLSTIALSTPSAIAQEQDPRFQEQAEIPTSLATTKFSVSPTVRLKPEAPLSVLDDVTLNPKLDVMPASGLRLIMGTSSPATSDLLLKSSFNVKPSRTARDLAVVSPTTEPLIAQSDSAAPIETPAVPTSSEPEGENLAKSSQNPIANLISVPLQSNWNFGIGPFDRTQYLLNVQPVIPVSLSPDWLLVSRIVTPILNQPDAQSPDGSTFGLGDINPQFFFVPKNTGNLTWGIGPQFVFPTATARELGAGKWSIGPTAVIVYTQNQWVLGALVNQAWSIAGDSDRRSVSQFLIQPFINYNLPDGWYVTTGPSITANWMADAGNQWTVPLGGGFGKLLKIDKQPINVSLQAYAYVVKPEAGPDWLLRFQVQLLFPTGGR